MKVCSSSTKFLGLKSKTSSNIILLQNYLNQKRNKMTSKMMECLFCHRNNSEIMVEFKMTLMIVVKLWQTRKNVMLEIQTKMLDKLLMSIIIASLVIVKSWRITYLLVDQELMRYRLLLRLSKTQNYWRKTM